MILTIGAQQQMRLWVESVVSNEAILRRVVHIAAPVFH